MESFLVEFGSDQSRLRWLIRLRICFQRLPHRDKPARLRDFQNFLRAIARQRRFSKPSKPRPGVVAQFEQVTRNNGLSYCGDFCGDQYPNPTQHATASHTFREA
jgi:hypothetical protein